MTDRDYDRLAGVAAIAAGIGGLVYSVAFIGGVVLGRAPDAGKAISSAALMVGGLLTAAVAVALYERATKVSQPGAIVGLAFAITGSLGSAVHGAYDLANVIHPPDLDVLGRSGLPNPIDPRGFLTFGAAGIGLFVLVWLVRRSGGMGGWLGVLGLLVAVLLVVIYLGRLIIFSPTNPIVAGIAGLTGFILSPVFYVGLGLWLRRGDPG